MLVSYTVPEICQAEDPKILRVIPEMSCQSILEHAFKTFCIFNSPGVPGVVQNISQVKASRATRFIIRRPLGAENDRVSWLSVWCHVWFFTSSLKVATSNIL